jgi:hypothetical protein
VFWEFGMLEEDDVVIGTRCGERVPNACQCLLLIVGVQSDLEDPELVRFADLTLG